MPTVDNVEELAPGVHRIQAIMDDKYHGYHVLEGPSGPIIIDPGYAEAPTEIYEPVLDEFGWELPDVNLTIVTHSDADHHGGNHQLKEHNPAAVIAAHREDVPLIESVETIINERYKQFSDAHGIQYPDEVYDMLRGLMGPDETVDIQLSGGEGVRVFDRTLTVVHTPGHTAGHVMLHDGEHDVVIGADGFFGRGLPDVDGNYLQPPPYYLYPEYENTIESVKALGPSTLSFTHYEVMRGGEIPQFMSESLDFVSEMNALALELVEEHNVITIQEGIEEVVSRWGSFGLDLDFAYPLSAHFNEFVAKGICETTEENGIMGYRKLEG